MSVIIWCIKGVSVEIMKCDRVYLGIKISLGSTFTISTNSTNLNAIFEIEISIKNVYSPLFF